MLTGDLVRARIKGKDIVPAFLDPSSEQRQERAEELLALFRRATTDGSTRGELEEAARELEGTDPDHKITRGLTKVLLDRCTFETICPTEPTELRFEVFRRAAAAGPLARRPGPTGRRTARDILSELATTLPPPPVPEPEDEDEEPPANLRPTEWSPEALSRALYADLKDEQQLTGADLPPDGEALLHRYNLALVQALLLRATRLYVRLTRPGPKPVRQLFRFLKFNQLMFRANVLGGDLVLEIDGPQTLIRQSTRYGLKIASFFPALPLQPGDWWAEADILWGKARKLHKRLVLSKEMDLRSFYKDTGTWRSRTERWFEERFLALESGWTMEPGQLIDLGEQRFLVPDFSFRKGNRTAHLDIVGYWRRGYLEKRIEETPDDVILAVSKRLLGDKATELPARLQDRVVSFAEVIPAKDVLERIEAVARG